MSILDNSASCGSPGLLSPGFTWIYTDQPAGHTAGAKWKCKLFLARNFHQSAPCARNVLTLNSPLVTAACCLGTRVTLPSRVPPPLPTEGEELMVSRLHKSVLSTFYSIHGQIIWWNICRNMDDFNCNNTFWLANCLQKREQTKRVYNYDYGQMRVQYWKYVCRYFDLSFENVL